MLKKYYDFLLGLLLHPNYTFQKMSPNHYILWYHIIVYIKNDEKPVKKENFMSKRIFVRVFILALIFAFNSIFCLDATADDKDNYYSEEAISVLLDGEMLRFDSNPVIIEGRTLVPIRTIAEAFNCDVEWDAENLCVKVKSDKITMEIKIGSDRVTEYSSESVNTYQLDVPATVINDRTYLPLRKTADIFGVGVSWDDKTHSVHLSKNLTRDLVIKNHTYYFQNDESLMLPKFGSGYCWACSYAMIINDIVGNVTPLDIKSVNERYFDNGALCYHNIIAQEFGLKLVPAVDKNSEYFERFDADYGSTYIKNTDKSDEVIINALREALKIHPEGVMVRFEQYPHTIVAVAYVEGKILFNDPAPSLWQQYSDKGSMMAVPFEKTYPYQKGLTLSDMNYIQALDKK